MKRFLVQLAFFVLPVMLVSYFLDLFISKNLKKSNYYGEKEYPTWNAILDGKINSDIVIYGSSRAWKHVDATMITDSLHLPAYNLGMDGHNFWLQYLRHSLLLKNNTPPKLIIQTLDVMTLIKRKDLYNSDQFLPYMLWNNAIKDATYSYEGFSIFDYELPLVRYSGKLELIKSAIRSSINPKNKKPGRIKGFLPTDQSWNGDFDRAKKAKKSYEAVLDSASIALFERYINECKAKNIKILFVYTPEYIDGQKFTLNRNEVMAIYTKLSAQYNIPYLDYSSDSMSFDKKYFYNSLHLNKTGAEIFTHNLIEKIKTMQLLDSADKPKPAVIN